MTELKPVRCGCGGEASCYYTHYWGKCFSVQCSECGIEIKPCDTEAEAIEVWNKAMGAKDINVPNKGDLISRQDVIDALELSLENDYVDATEFLTFVKQLPSAEPERKTGEWIKEDLSGYLTPGGNSIYHCSECGHTEGPWPHPRLTDFCPSCGADMRGEE